MVWVGGLPEGYNKPDVEQAFDNFGAISNIVVAKSRSAAGSYTPGYAFIEFKKKLVFITEFLALFLSFSMT